MTKDELARLVEARDDAWAALGNSNSSLGELSPVKRQKMDAASARFRQAGDAIVAELRGRNGPVDVVVDGEPMLLWLTKYRDAFAECDPATRLPLYASTAAAARELKHLLYRYPNARAAV